MKKSGLLRVAAFLFAALFISLSCTSQHPEKGVGLELWSVQREMNADPVNTIQKVGAMGYNFVESASYSNGLIYGMEPEAFGELVTSNGMKNLTAHSGVAIPDSGSWEVLMPWWDVCIETHKKAGVEYIAQPFMGGSAYASLAGLADYCAYFNAVGQKCKDAGLKFGYHNYDQEFKTLEGEVIYDYMLKHTDPELVTFQLDVYWAYKGGADPAEYIRKYGDRFASIHIKDEKEVGESGEIDFAPLLRLALENGAEYMVVEVENYNHEPLESVKISLDYLREIGFAK